MTNLPKLFINISAGSVLIISGSFLLSRSLEALSADKLPAVARAARRSPLYAFVMSTLVTAAVQSSSAITALTVSLAESGFLSLPAAMAVVYGANIGTTVSAQIMSLDISGLWLYLILAGMALKGVSIAIEGAGRPAVACIALGMIFLGLRTLSLSAALIKQSGFIMNFIRLYGDNPLYGVFFGFVSTALIHSSSATVGLTLALFSGGVIDLRQAVAITLGDNIGTCVTALIASVASGARGRRVAWGHMLYNAACAVIVLIFMDGFLTLVRVTTELLGQPSSFLVANAHAILNILGAVLFLPLNRRFCGLLELLVRGEGV